MSRTIRIFALLAALAIVVDLVGHRRALRADDVYRVASVRIPERGLRAYRPGEVIVQFKEAVRDRDASDMMHEAGGRSARIASSLVKSWSFHSSSFRKLRSLRPTKSRLTRDLI